MMDSLINSKNYYQNGLRLKTKISVYEFTERWANIKYLVKEEDILKKWQPMKHAEMQKNELAYPIGYFASTTERGDYDTIQKTISRETGVHTEVSFQFIDQMGVLPKMWRFTRERAEEAFSNLYSKEHKRVKFSYAPSALVVHVDDEKNIKSARRKMIANLENSMRHNGQRWQTDLGCNLYQL